MSKPLVISLPHQLGKDEAMRRIKAGTEQIRTQYGHIIALEDETWTGDQLAFRIRALAQTVSGTIEVAEETCTLTMTLPWLLQMIAEKAQAVLKKEGALLLEKKK